MNLNYLKTYKNLRIKFLKTNWKNKSSCSLDIHCAKLLDQLCHVGILVFVECFMDWVDFRNQDGYFLDYVLSLLVFKLDLFFLAQLGGACLLFFTLSVFFCLHLLPILCALETEIFSILS